MTTRLTKERGWPQAREMSRICEHIEDLFDELDATRAELEEANGHLSALIAASAARHLEEVASLMDSDRICSEVCSEVCSEASIFARSSARRSPMISASRSFAFARSRSTSERPEASAMTTTIEAGRWYRRRSDGLVVRTVWGHDGAWLCEMVDGTTNAAMADILEPWVPRVGEWVRVSSAHRSLSRLPQQVLAYDSAGGCVMVTRGGGPASAYEPCAPPAEALKDTTPEVSHRRDDGTRCHRCGGPAYTGLGVGGPPECLAPRCEPRSELDPTVLERWLTRTEGVFAIPVPGGERVWWAIGHGWTTMHPIREEAVARWKEIVHRKR